MVLDRAALATCFSLALSASALAQQQHAEPKIIEIESSAAGVLSSRRVQTRTTSGDGDLVTETIQTPDVDGRWQTSHETETETVGKGSATTVRHDVYAYGAQRERLLLERTETDRARSSDGSVQSVSRTWTADLNGRLDLTSQVIEDSSSNAGASAASTRVFVRDVNGKLSETAQTTVGERQFSSGAARHDTNVMRRDLNGRWQSIETRQTDVRDDGSAEHLEEETVSRPDMNDVVGISERTITRRSQTNGGEDALIERYVPRDPGAVSRSANRMELSERVRVTTSTASDGTRQTIEEVEGRSPVAAGDPMRLRRRIVTTVRPLGGANSLIERQIFDLDANGRLVLTATERGEGSAP
jgi:hypothetical protein